MQVLGKSLLVLGIVLAGIGIVLMFSDKIPFLGKLPGDITIRRDNVRVFIPITTSILLSVLISLVLWVVSLFKSK